MSKIQEWNPPGKIRFCAVCGIEENNLHGAVMMVCTGCRFMTYCSAACQKKGWRDHKELCRTQRLRHSQMEQSALSSPVQARAEGEAIEFCALVLPDVSEALYNANRINTSTPLNRTHNVVLHFAYYPSQPTLRRRFVFQSGKILPRAEVKSHVISTIGYYIPLLDTALLPADIVKKFTFKPGKLPSVVLNLYTPLLPASPLFAPTIAHDKMPMAKPLVADWERVLRLTLDGDQPKDKDAIEDAWLVESGTARAHEEKLRRLFGEEAYQNEVSILAPLILKKEAEEKAKPQS